MVGIFSRFSSGRSGHRRTQSAIDLREPSQPTTEVVVPTTAASVNSHGIEISAEFKPVEHPTEPLDHDQPVRCPLPEPSIINDGRIWKERMSANVLTIADLPIAKGSSPLESETTGSRTRSGTAKHVILPSHSAPEHNLVNLLEECNAA
uniref:Histone acetyltransferase mst1 n=1 Tax=Anthurium amnicola TaxID=1678845 RepID=A0A1D1Y358_9ARAE